MLNDIKPRPNHQLYLQTLNKMSEQERLMKAFELSEFSKNLFREGLRARFPEKTAEQLHELYLNRLAKCYNQNF